MQNDKLISRRQLMALSFTGMLSPMIRLIPSLPALLAGKAAWLAPVAALPIAWLYYRMLSGLVDMCRDGEGLFELSTAAWGRRLGTASSLLVAIWLTLYSGFTLRTASERLLSTVYNTGRTGLFSLVAIAMAVIAARGSLRFLARAAAIFAGVIGLTILPLMFFAVPDIDLSNLLPLVPSDAKGIFLSVLPVMDIMSYGGYFLFLLGGTRRDGEDEGVTRRGMLFMLGVMLLLLVTTLGSLSAPLCSRLRHPFFIMVRNITLFGLIERVEALVLGLWVMTDFVFLSGQIMIASYIICKVLPRPRRETWCVILGAAGFVISFLMGSSAFDLVPLSHFYVPVSNIVLTLILIPAVWLTLKIRRGKLK